MQRLLTKIEIILLGLLASVPHASSEDIILPNISIEQTRAICIQAQSGTINPEDITEIIAAGASDISVIHNQPSRFDAVLFDGETRITIRIHRPDSEVQRTRLRIEATEGSQQTGPAQLINMGPDCRVENARLVDFDDKGIPINLFHFVGDPPILQQMEPLNPAVPPGIDPGGIAIAQIDSGVNYTLAEIAVRLARDPSGQIFGRDLSDHDLRPFDLDPASSVLLPRRHGTGVASLILREAPKARLIPIRHPGKNSQAFAQIVDIIAASPARIVAMPLGSKTRDDWTEFAQAAARHPDILFIISAGNNGYNIDQDPIYPASFVHENFLVVTSVDSFGRLPRESSWGPVAVDIAVPAEMIDVIDHRGAIVRASGTSYAVPRVTALAARISAANPEWKAVKIKAEILKFAILLPRRGNGKTRYGWLPNPTAVGPKAPL